MRHGEDLYEIFRLWAAFEEALDGDTNRARGHLATLPPRLTDERFRPLRYLTDLLIWLNLAPKENRRHLRREVRARLEGAFAGTRPCYSPRYVRDAYHRLIEVVARQTGGLRLWGWWFYRGGRWWVVGFLLLLAPLALAVPPVALLALILVLRNYRRD